MRICLLAPSLETGGAERQLVLLAGGLAGRGHDVDVVLFRATGPLLADLVSTVRLRDLGKGGKADLRFLWRLWRILRRGRFDCLYTFLGVPNIAGALLRPFVRPVGLVWSVRASNMDLRAYSTAARAAAWLETRLSGAPDVIIANAEAGKGYAVSRGFPADRTVVVPNGVDTRVFAPDRAAGAALRREWTGGTGGPLVGLVARVDPMKGHAVFLEAAARLAGELPAVHFVCVGGGEAALGDRLRREAAKLGLGGRLTWAGSRDDMPAVYNALDVCCLPSRFGEGFPNVLGEAMACGVPCVTTDVGDAAELVGDAGRVAPPDDPAALAEALGEVLARPEGFADPRARIEERFSVEVMVDATASILCAAGERARRNRQV